MLFGALGVGLIVFGGWALLRADKLDVAPSWDENSGDRRRRVLRRGAFTCIGIGVLFLLATGLSLISPPPPGAPR